MLMETPYVIPHEKIILSVELSIPSLYYKKLCIYKTEKCVLHSCVNNEILLGGWPRIYVSDSHELEVKIICSKVFIERSFIIIKIYAEKKIIINSETNV